MFEMYARRGRVDAPHYAMSITKTLTSMILGRAMQLGHVKLEELDRPVIEFMPAINRKTIQPGVETITLRDALMMKSGLRFKDRALEHQLAARFEGRRFSRSCLRTQHRSPSRASSLNIRARIHCW